MNKSQFQSKAFSCSILYLDSIRTKCSSCTNGVRIVQQTVVTECLQCFHVLNST